MAFNQKIKLGNIWLTSDGTEAGFPCQINVLGLPDLKMKWWGNAARNARGNPEMNLTEPSGIDITLQIQAIRVEVFDDIIEMFDDALDNDATFDFVVEGETGNYDLQAEPNPDRSVNWENSTEGFVETVEIKILTVVEET